MTSGIVANAKSTETPIRNLTCTWLQRFWCFNLKDLRRRNLRVIRAGQASLIWPMLKYVSKKKLMSQSISQWMDLMLKNMSKWIVKKQEYHPPMICLVLSIILVLWMEVITQLHAKTVLMINGTTSTMARCQVQVVKNSCKMQHMYCSIEEEKSRQHHRTQVQQQRRMFKAVPLNQVMLRVKTRNYHKPNQKEHSPPPTLRKRKQTRKLTMARKCIIKKTMISSMSLIESKK